MSSSAPAHLNNHFLNTLREIVQHPAGHNLDGHAVVSLAVVERRRMQSRVGYGPDSGGAGVDRT